MNLDLWGARSRLGRETMPCMNLYFTETNVQVELPQELTSFRGDSYVVSRVAYPSGGGSSGKVETADGRYFYPGVFGCYIADEPKESAA